jgi:hypothetical protein
MCAVVYDVGTPTSLQSCGRWLSSVRHSRPERPIPGVLIANKTDLYQSKPDCLNSEAGQRFAATNGLKFFEVSVRTCVRALFCSRCKPWRLAWRLLSADSVRVLIARDWLGPSQMPPSPPARHSTRI